MVYTLLIFCRELIGNGEPHHVAMMGLSVASNILFHDRKHMVVTRFALSGRSLVTSLTLSLIAVLAIGCSSDSTPLVPAVPGKLISHDSIKTYDRQEFERIRSVDLEDFFKNSTMTAGDFLGGFPTTYKNVSLYRIAYESVIPEWNNQRVLAYGLVAIPEGATNGTPILSYQHGVIFDKNAVPSNPDESAETRLALLQYASQGYIVVAADYFGNGSLSSVPNTYFLKRSAEQAMFDMHMASFEFLKTKNIQPGRLFLLGWSQGGYNTMLHLRMLEGAAIPVAAAATASGPGSPFHLIARALYAPRAFDPAWESLIITNLIFAYETYFGLTGCSKEFIKPGIYETAKAFYEFRTDANSYLGAGGNLLENVLTMKFAETGKIKSHEFWQLLSQAESYIWLSKAPLRQYYSNRDEGVPKELAIAGVEYQTSIGKTNATSHNAGDSADHRSVYVRTLVDTKPWFDSLK